MPTAESAEPFVPERRSLPSLRAAAAGCKGCRLWAGATQTVFGEGTAAAEVILVGEQPGDREDVEGAPFVGPAGRELDRGLEAAGIDRRRVYVTNAVKHFKFEPRGKRRIHQKPNWSELAACRPWLDAEIELVRPKVIVCLGATAAQSLLGRSFRVTRQRGEAIAGEPLAEWIVATIHPSAILRQRDDDARHAERDAFADDLRAVARLL
ncbi:MAG TPA: UdgX family uracil-DNA binding protein [Gaiellaceae bacterium]|nr:UdgX family uracil-DNA binding protein [Gaiellaceae bacterium]